MVSDLRCPRCHDAVHPCRYDSHVPSCKGPGTLDEHAKMIAGEIHDLLCVDGTLPVESLCVELYEALHKALAGPGRELIVRHLKEAVRAAADEIDRSGSIDVDTM